MKSNYYKVKEFVCPHCGRDFKKERQLKAHIKSLHKDIKAEKEKC